MFQLGIFGTQLECSSEIVCFKVIISLSVPSMISVVDFFAAALRAAVSRSDYVWRTTLCGA